MPKVRAVEEMNATELRAELVSVLADGFLRYMQSDQFAIQSRRSRQRSRIRDSLP
jgi:hypothetical protein